MTPAQTTLEAALIHADPSSEMALEIRKIIRDEILNTLTELVTQYGQGLLAVPSSNGAVSNPMTTYEQNLFARNEHAIKRAALRGIKEHFNSPQQIF